MSIVRVFVGANANGNPCEIVAGPVPVQVTKMRAGITRCYSWESALPLQFGVACFAPGGEAIQCCGHGLLAAAWYWYRRGMSAPLQLVMGGSRIECQSRADLLWLLFDRLASESILLPHWVDTVFGSRPMRAATAGPEQGYLVLEWPGGFRLEALSPPSMELTRYTSRAIIACSRSGDKPGAIRFRYFAPQYGVAEDSATGSAMRILLDYCQKNYQLDYLEAFQCSPAGGVLFARAVANRIAVGGRVWPDTL